MSKKIVKPHIRAIQVTTKAEQVCSEDPDRENLLVYNNGTATVYLVSEENQKYAQGIPIAVGTAYENNVSTGAYWILSASGTHDVRVEIDGR